MKVVYKGQDEMWFLLAFSDTEFKPGIKGFFLEIFRHRWDIILTRSSK